MTSNPDKPTPDKPTLGRPKVATPEIFQEAAMELIQLNGFDKTSVEEIARVAGYSRATFFNHFATKADVFWLEVDRILKEIESLHQAGQITSFEDLVDVLDKSLTDSNIPWIFGNFWLLKNGNEILTGGVHRFFRIQAVIQEVTTQMFPTLAPADIRTKTYQYMATLLSSLQNWQEAGVGRKSFAAYL